MVVLYILLFIVFLSILIMIHELGHAHEDYFSIYASFDHNEYINSEQQRLYDYYINFDSSNMPMRDYFRKNACSKIIQVQTTNRLGGVEISETFGEGFDGLLVKKNLGETITGADRTVKVGAYNLHVNANQSLAKDDKIRYTDLDGSFTYVKLVTDAIFNEPRSGQTDWKTYECEVYHPVS